VKGTTDHGLILGLLLYAWLVGPRFVACYRKPALRGASCWDIDLFWMDPLMDEGKPFFFCGKKLSVCTHTPDFPSAILRRANLPGLAGSWPDVQIAQ